MRADLVKTKKQLLGQVCFLEALPAVRFNPKPSMRLELMTSSLPMKYHQSIDSLQAKTFRGYIKIWGV
jgi:hypothetical protein